MSKPVIVVDFDGTITDTHYPHTGKPQAGVKDSLQKLRDMGFAIRVLSCRTSPELHPEGTRGLRQRIQQQMLIVEYLSKFEIPFDEVVLGDKPVAEAYIDDRGINHNGDWNETLDNTLKLLTRK